MKFWPVWIQGS